MIVWLASYPRSGNTYLRTLMFHLYGRQSLGRLQGPANATPNYWSDGRRPGAAAMANPSETFLVKTHELPGPDRSSAIYILRDGRDSLASYAHYSATLSGTRPADASAVRDALCALIHDRSGAFGSWSQNVVAWCARPRTAILRFEDLIADPSRLEAAVAELGLSWKRCANAKTPTFAELQRVHPRNFRRGVVGAWRGDFTPQLEEAFWEEHGFAMEAHGYRRECLEHRE